MTHHVTLSYQMLGTHGYSPCVLLDRLIIFIIIHIIRYHSPLRDIYTIKILVYHLVNIIAYVLRGGHSPIIKVCAPSERILPSTFFSKYDFRYILNVTGVMSFIVVACERATELGFRATRFAIEALQSIEKPLAVTLVAANFRKSPTKIRWQGFDDIQTS